MAGEPDEDLFEIVTAKARGTRGKTKEGLYVDIELIATRIVASAFKVHTALGPGLLESAYQKCMEYELKKDGTEVACEVILPITYGPITIDAGYRIDMVVAGR